MLKGKSLLHYTNLFSLNEYEKNNKTILKHFQLILKRLTWYFVLFVVSIKNQISPLKDKKTCYNYLSSLKDFE